MIELGAEYTAALTVADDNGQISDSSSGALPILTGPSLLIS